LSKNKKNSKEVLLSSIKMAIATFFSRILGLVREQVMAATFGAGGLTDAFLVAYRIPNLLRDLFAEGAFSSAFVPTFVEANQISKEKARQLLWALFILLGLTTLFFSGMIFIFAEELISLFAPSFKADPQKFLITVNLTKIMSPFLLFVSIAALFMGVLNSLKIFFIPSLAPAFFNITMILCMIALPSYFITQGIPTIYSLGVGAFLGGLIQAFVQVPLIIKQGFAPTKPEKILTKKSKKVVKLLGPGLIGFAATQINMVVTTILASGTLVGAVSWLSFAFRMFQLPVGILGVSIGNSNLVHFSSAWKAGDLDKAKELVGGSYFLSIFLVLPPMIGLIIFNEEIIRIIFEHGLFTAESTMQTAKALKWYALGLPFYGIYKIFVPTFYAIDRQKVPVYCSIFSIAANVVFCILLTPIYGFEVLAFGTTLSMFLNSTIQTIILKNDLRLKITHFISLRLVKVIAAAAITFIASSYLKTILFLGEQSFFTQATELFLNLIFIVMCYGILVFAFGERSIVLNFLNKIKNKL
jgi:putative peptidoglycan lipid II flippase